MKIALPVVVLVAAAALIVARESARPPAGDTFAGPRRGVPTLLDLGADRCIPCKKMAPILKEMKQEYRGVLEVVFIDVWRNWTAGRQYGIRLIPTQIFYDADGREIGRHEGFIGKADILDTFRRLGVKLKTPQG